MQNTMLDSVVSSNSQELFDFNAIHNGEHCIASLDPKDRGTERQFRFTRALLCTLLGVKSENTITNHIDALINRGVVNDVKNLTSLNIKNENGNGAVKTTLYDLTVFNHLVMRLDTDKAWAMKEKFNDVLIKHETGVTQAQLELTDAEIMSRALEIAHRTLALREERIKALEADLTSEKEAHEKDNADFRTGFDILNAQKARIGSSREATAMATASAKSRECKRLAAENAELKDAVGRGNNWHTVSMMKAEWIRDFGHAPVWQKLKLFSADLPADMQPVRDVEVKVVLQNGSEKINKVFRYHREAWAKYREYEENSRVSEESRRDASNEGIGSNDTDTEIEYF